MLLLLEVVPLSFLESGFACLYLPKNRKERGPFRTW